MRKPLAIGVAIAIAVGIAACSKKDEASAPAATTVARFFFPAPASSSTTAAPPLKADFIVKADAICTRFDRARSGLAFPTSKDDVLPIARQMLTLTADQQREMVALGVAPTETDVWRSILVKQGDVIDRLRGLLDDPALSPDKLMADAQVPAMQKEANALMRQFGLTVCGADTGARSDASGTSVPSASSSTAPPPSTAPTPSSSTTTTSSTTSSAPPIPSTTLDPTGCAKVNRDFTALLSGPADAAMAAAASLDALNPPPPAASALGRIAATGHATPDDSALVLAWVQAICPT